MSESGRVERGHRLRMVFDGVIAVGPPHPADGGDQDGPLFGVMARSTRQLSDRSRRNPDEVKRFIPMHVPTIYTRHPPAEGSRPPDQIFQLADTLPEWYIWHPVRERLEFAFDGDATPGKLTYDRQGEPVPEPEPDVDEWDVLRMLDTGRLPRSPLSIRSITQVPDARTIWPERSFLQDGMLSDEPGVRSEVASQIFVPRGAVSGGGLFEKGGGVDVEFSPAIHSAALQTVVPNVVVSVQTQSVEIAMFSLDTGEPLDSIRFELTEDTDLWISNGDPTDTTIDMKRVSKVVALQKAIVEGLPRADKLTEAFEKGAIVPANMDALRRVNFIFNSGHGVIAHGMTRPDPNRVSDVDIDFELFYPLLEDDPNRVGKPVPRRPGGVPFNGPDCFTKLVSSRQKPRMKSLRR
jgi:hypothetical protein